MVETGGQKKVTYICGQDGDGGCGRKRVITVGGADAELYVKMVSALSSAAPKLKPVDGDVNAKAVKILSDLSEMTSAQLAEYIVSLEAELAA